MSNKNFCPYLSQMWITQGGGRLNRNNEFVATNLSPKTPNFRSKNSLKTQTISKAKLYKNSLKNTKHYIKNLIYFRHIFNVSFRVYCRRLN